MAEYKDSSKRLCVNHSYADRMWFRVEDERGASGSGVSLPGDQLRALRAQIDKHLGDTTLAPDRKPLPVGTIVVGKGLTEVQKKNLPDAGNLRALAATLNNNIKSFDWQDTEEKSFFWLKIHERLMSMANAVDEEKERQKTPLSETVSGFTVSTTMGGNVSIRQSVGGYVDLTTNNARALAAALVAHAEHAEKSSSKS